MEIKEEISKLESQYAVKITHTELKNLAGTDQPNCYGWEFVIHFKNKIKSERLTEKVDTYSKLNSVYNKNYKMIIKTEYDLTVKWNVEYMELIIKIATGEIK